MKLVLSRKGFDSGTGGHPSPILPDGRMLSLPIPSSLDVLKYDEIRAMPGKSVQDILTELDAHPRIEAKGAHLDPDLVEMARPRKPGWRPALGQVEAAAGHLRNQKIGPRDLFLFYGWFRQTEAIDGRLRFKKGAEDLHIIYGYLQVDTVCPVKDLEGLPEWLLDHPHTLPSRLLLKNNSIFIARPTLSWNHSMSGAGTFRFSDRLVLTQRGMSRGRWNLDPALFRHLPITYHSLDSWKAGYFQSYARAQEYVVDADGPAEMWARSLIDEVAISTSNCIQAQRKI